MQGLRRGLARQPGTARVCSLLALMASLASVACGSRSAGPSDDSAATQAALARVHAAYVAGINANSVDAWVETLSDDVQYFVPNRKAIVGKSAVGAWVSKYLQEVTTRWTKTVSEFTVSGDWAFATYSYTASDSVIIRDPETEGGGTANDSGWGLVVYHRGPDGTWRVARDGWGTDRPAR